MTAFTRTAIAGAALAAVLLLHVAAVGGRATREPHVDEIEYLHASWLMANGGKLYVTFIEHHSPLFFRAIAFVAERGTDVDVVAYFVRARWLSGVFGGLALLALGMIVWMTARVPAFLAVALVIATGPVWLRTLAEVRAEPFALAFFWVGTWLVLRFRGAVGGAGLGLLVISCLFQPKFPVSCVVVGLFWLARNRSVRGALAALAISALGFAAVAAIVPLPVWWFFNYDFNAALAHFVATSERTLEMFFRNDPLVFVPDFFHPTIAAPAALLVGAAAWIERRAERLFPAALLLASFLELRFIHPWPGIWQHNWILWSMAAAATLALVPSSATIVIRRCGGSESLQRFAATAVLSVATLLAVARLVAIRPASRLGEAPYWVLQKYLQSRLGPNDRVWLDARRHPVAAHDAHYYWFSPDQMAAAARELRETPRGRRYLPPPEDFPICTVPPNLRYTLDPRATPGASSPELVACMERLLASGRVRRTPFRDIDEVLPPS